MVHHAATSEEVEDLKAMQHCQASRGRESYHIAKDVTTRGTLILHTIAALFSTRAFHPLTWKDGWIER